MIKKSLYDISWQVTEQEYRADPALSYSTLARYERTGFNELDKLFDKIETPSLTFGSAVDSLITGGTKEFEERFILADYPTTSPSIILIVKRLFSELSEKYNNLELIPDKDVINAAAIDNFQPNWKAETRAKVIKEKGSQYYRLLYLAKDKTILDSQTYNDVMRTVEALYTSDATKFYFQVNSPFELIERCYQLKFKASFNDVDYRCMADLIVVDHSSKTIIPVDLKTSSKKEWDFYKSFIEWLYPVQARLYWRIIRDNLDKDDYFKDFKLLDYRFIVVNRYSLTPLVWEFKDTQKKGTLNYGKTKHIELRDPFEIGSELNYYLKNNSRVPLGIDINNTNDLTTWLDKL
jgi:hypothetical protein